MSRAMSSSNFCGLAHSTVWRRSSVRGSVVALGQQQVAIAIALQGIEQRICGLPFFLPPLGVGECLRGRLAPASGMQGIGIGRTRASQYQKFIAAAVGMGDGLFRRRHGGGDLAGEQLGFTEVGRGDRGVTPVLLVLVLPKRHAHRRQRLGQPSLRAQGEGCLSEHPGLGRRRQRGHWALRRACRRTRTTPPGRCRRRRASCWHRTRSRRRADAGRCGPRKSRPAHPGGGRRGSRERWPGRAARGLRASACRLLWSCRAGARRAGRGRRARPPRSSP